MTDQTFIINDIFNFDFEGPDDAEQWEGEFRIIQWNNSEMKAEFPQKHWLGSEIEMAHELVDIEHGEAGEAIEPGFLLDTINISVIAHRSIWEAKGADGEKMYTQEPDFAIARWNKRYNFLCILQEGGDFEPVILTAKSHTGQFIYKAISQARKRTIGLVKRLTGKNLPGYLFWITLASPGKSGKRVVGNEIKNAIYPPMALTHDISKLKKPGIINLMKSLYVGDEIRNLYEDGLYESGQEWAIEIPQQALLPDVIKSTDAQILADGTLWFPDLSEAKPTEMKTCGMSTGLFRHQSHADRAFAKVMRDQGVGGATDPDKWEAWRQELEARWAHKVALDADIALEEELRGPMPQAIAEQSAMEEIEADSEIPPTFR